MDTPKPPSRRSFILGVGAFATAVFAPKVPKLIFPVQNNPLVTPSSFDVHRMWVDTNRVGNRKAYFWMGGPKGQPIRLYKKWDNPPQHLFDFDEVVRNDAPERQFDYGGGMLSLYNSSGVDRKFIFAPGMWTPPKRGVSGGTPIPSEEFKSKVFQLEKHFHGETT